MSDENEPVAWAALRDDGDIAWIGYSPEGAADGACGRRIVPLYRSPTLTDAEREAITPEEIEALRWGIRLMADAGMANSVETLKALMERLK